MTRAGAFLCALAALTVPGNGQEGDPLPGTERLEWTDDLAARMMRGLHRHAEALIAGSVSARARHWKRDLSSAAAYEKSVEPNRRRLLKSIGAVDSRVLARLERFGDDDARPALVAESERFRAWQVRWPVLEGVTGEGLLLEPRGKPVAHVVALPDADQTPEQLAGLAPGVGSPFARRLAESGVRVVIPTLISRAVEGSGNPRVAMTNQPHREWIYRQAYHMGRHVIGYEVQKILAVVDWMSGRPDGGRIGVAGYGEGGLLALYAAAADPRIQATLVSGAFGPRERVWEEPLYRNVWGLLREFGDAEIASLIAPRGLVIEHSAGPRVDGPPATAQGRRGGAAVGKLGTPSWDAVAAEYGRLETLVPASLQKRFLVGELAPGRSGRAECLQRFAGLLGVSSEMAFSNEVLSDLRAGFDPGARQLRQVREIEDHVQRLLRGADATRHAFFLGQTSLLRGLESRAQRFRMARVPTRSAETFAEESRKFRHYFRDEVLGRIEEPVLPPNARSRRIYDREKWSGYDVVLDVFPDVFAWGILLVPKGMKPGEKRPVVVCQHGRNGLPKETVEGDSWAYHNFAAALADRGFVVFSPHNLYRGEDLYRVLNRKANAVKHSMFSYILAQHQQILHWLTTLPFVDPKRMAFYGLSYGGETAVRVPAILEDYALSICSGDFNDWARKVASTDSDYSFMFTVEWEMPYFDMGSTFNYAEMAYLMVPRPFMVERGHHDGVAPDEWVSSEYARVRWLYAQLGLADRTEIEYYNGGHIINAQGTFDFLHRHLRWPKP